MEKFKELSIEEMQEVDGGILPLLLLAGAVELAGYAIGFGCATLAGDILINWSSYENSINNKLDNCKN
jgi:lactobin A/cerein 7B family class IIb bacteriocin